MPYYKVVNPVGDKLVSIYATGKWQVEYKEGEWAEAPTYAYVYETTDPDKCVEWTHNLELWEVEVEDVHKGWPRAMDIGYPKEWDYFWTCGHRDSYSLGSHVTWAKRVRLTKRLGTRGDYYETHVE